MFLLIGFSIALVYLSIMTYTSYVEKTGFWTRKIIDCIVVLSCVYLVHLETLS